MFEYEINGDNNGAAGLYLVELTTLVVRGTDCIGSCKIQLPCDHDHYGH
jgi:hypothetical protein